MGWLSNIFSRRPSSKEIARDRLKLVLVHDRATCSPDLLKMMKNDILQAISKYIDISSDIDINISTEGGHTTLSANIPIKSMRRRR
jgi:cell division topological specificity factor